MPKAYVTNVMHLGYTLHTQYVYVCCVRRYIYASKGWIAFVAQIDIQCIWLAQVLFIMIRI